MNITPVLGIALLGILTVLAGWWLGSRVAKTSVEPLAQALRESKDQIERQRGERDSLLAERAAFEAQATGLRQLTEQQNSALENLRSQYGELAKEGVRVQEQLTASQQSLAEERASFTRIKEEMTNTFNVLAAQSLSSTSHQFLALANEKFDAKQEAIDTLLKPVKQTLDNLNAQTQQLETRRAGAYSEVLTEIKNIQQTHLALRQETTQLVQTLRAPQARGNWGELQLKLCVKFAGMVEHCSYEVQKYMRGGEDESAQRPDAVIHLPNDRTIIVDSKNPGDAFLSAMRSNDEIQKRIFLQAHAADVRAHLKDLGSKQYWQRFNNSPEFVVCFLPSEVLFSAALEQDPSLIEAGTQLNVILATPTTLIALLKAVAYGWQQMEITRNAIEICQAGEALYRKLAGTQEHFTKMGNALSSSVRHFNNLVGAVEGRGSVFSLASRLHELKIGQEEIAEIASIEVAARTIQSDHWDEPVALAASEETFNR